MWNLAAALLILTVTSCYADTDDIVGGEPVKDGEFNFAVRVELRAYKGNGFYLACTGILLNNRTVLTSAYCTPTIDIGFENSTLRVTGGFYNLSDPMSTAQTRRVESYIIHPKYNYSAFPEAIGLLFLKEPFNTTGNQRFGFVEKFSTRKLDEKALISSDAYFAGFGDIIPKKDSIPDVLHKLKTSFVTNKKCQKLITKYGKLDVNEDMVCTFNTKAGPCAPDIGGPMGFFKKRKFVLVGMLFWGVAWNCKNGRVVGARMSSYSKWIKDNIAGDDAEMMYYM